MSKVRQDQFPNYQAGLKKDYSAESTANCLQPEQRSIQTPQQIVKYRKSFKEQHGVTIKHYGVVNDPVPPIEHIYGVATEKSQPAEKIMKANEKDYVGKYVNEIKESKYDSLKRQPLGKTIDRKYQLPSNTQSEQFKFGLATEKNQYGVKETIYSGQNMPESEQIRQLYLKSHKDYDPGEQKKRPYDWNIDPSDFRFGKVEKNVVHNEIKQVLSPESNIDKFPQTQFVKTNHHDFIDRKDDKLGKPMNLGQKQFPPDRVFGVRVEPNEWDAGKCIKGQANEYQVRPDDDLGKTNKHGFRNITKQGDEDRVFGVATIRYDIKKPAMQSMADPINYADETTAVQLLFPKEFAAFGVNDADFNQPRPKAQIKQIFQNIGCRFKGNIFDTLFERAKAIQGTILEKVSCNSFKKTINQMCN